MSCRIPGYPSDGDGVWGGTVKYNRVSVQRRADDKGASIVPRKPYKRHRLAWLIPENEPKTRVNLLWSGCVEREKREGEEWIERERERESERFVEKSQARRSGLGRRKRGLAREKEKWSGGGEEEKRDSAASTLHLVPRLLDLTQNTGLLLVSGGQCLQPCLSRGDGGAVQLGSCARYDARRPDGWLCSTAASPSTPCESPRLDSRGRFKLIYEHISLRRSGPSFGANFIRLSNRC